jgi:transposase-like protein
LISSQLYKWRTDAKAGAIMSIKNDGELHSKAEIEMLRRENDELKKALGESTLDIKILKKSSKWINNETRS